MEGEDLEQIEIPLLKALAVVGCLKRVDSAGRVLQFMPFLSHQLNLSVDCVRHIWIHRNNFYHGWKSICTKEEMKEIDIDWRILVLNKRCQPRRRVKRLCLKKRRCNEVPIPDPKVLGPLNFSSSNHCSPSFSIQSWEAFKRQRNSKNFVFYISDKLKWKSTGKRPDLWQLEKELMRLLGGYERKLMIIDSPEGEHPHEKEVGKDDSTTLTPIIVRNSQLDEKSGGENSSKQSAEKAGSSNEQSKGSLLDVVADVVPHRQPKMNSTSSRLCNTRTKLARGAWQRMFYKRRIFPRKEWHHDPGFIWKRKKPKTETHTHVISVSNTDTNNVVTPVTSSSQESSSVYTSEPSSPAQVNDCANPLDESGSTGLTLILPEETTQTQHDISGTTPTSILIEISKDPELGPIFRSFFRDYSNNDFSNQFGIDDIQLSVDEHDFDDTVITTVQEGEMMDFEFADLM